MGEGSASDGVVVFVVVVDNGECIEEASSSSLSSIEVSADQDFAFRFLDASTKPSTNEARRVRIRDS